MLDQREYGGRREEEGVDLVDYAVGGELDVCIK